MRLSIRLKMDNAAFFNDDRDNEPSGASGSECARILRELADQYDGRDLLPGENIKLRDINGNTVGDAQAMGR